MDASGFNFTDQMRRLIADMVQRLPELSHVDLYHVAISFAQARNRSSYGTYATLTPMRFDGGALSTNRDGRQYTVQRLYAPTGHEILYILTFYLPRFLDVDLNQKLVTILHELWHINPRFDGDIRRHEGRCYAHSRSQEHYDAGMQELANRWLAAAPPRGLYGFLELDFRQLREQYGRVYGTRIPHPKLLPCG
jgi:hypothetical protein